jgi:uncharacterized protein YvpB
MSVLPHPIRMERGSRAAPAGLLLALALVSLCLGAHAQPVAAAGATLSPSNSYSPLLVNADGTMEMFDRGQDASAYHSWQSIWGTWVALGDATPLETAPVTALNADGHGEAFAVATSGVLVHTWQAAWPGWGQLVGQGGLQFTGQPAVGRNADGRLEVFARSTRGDYWHAWQSTPGAQWIGWAPLLSGTFVSDPTVIQNADGRLEVFGVSASTQPVHGWQVVPNGSWAGWAGLGGSIRSRLSAIRNQDGRLEVFGIGFDGAAYNAWQVVAGGDWAGWGRLGGGIVSDPAAIVGSDGAAEVFVRAADGETFHSSRSAQGWSPWTSLGGYATAGPIATSEPNGTFSVWVLQNRTWFENYRPPGQGWSTWQWRGVVPAASSRAISVPWYHQQYVLSCEEASLRMALAYHGVVVNDTDVLNVIGIDWVHYWAGPGGGDPFRSFVGDPNGSEITQTGYGTYFPTIVGAAGHFSAPARAGGLIAPGDVYIWVLQGYPVVVWTTFDWQTPPRHDYVAYDGVGIPYAGPDEHAVTVVGVDPGRVLVNDPDRGQYWIDKSQFQAAYGVYGGMAVVP